MKTTIQIFLILALLGCSSGKVVNNPFDNHDPILLDSTLAPCSDLEVNPNTEYISPECKTIHFRTKFGMPLIWGALSMIAFLIWIVWVVKSEPYQDEEDPPHDFD